ncbi:hypothetical protein CF326_g4963 [Tilletia indica]|nr:hypothetical protein CF326_g4963 [Tilletia indica]
MTSSTSHPKQTKLDWLDLDPVGAGVSPVPRYPALHRTVDKDYPDYGLPSPQAYIAPDGSPLGFVFMGVDFSDPFDPLTFPLPATHRRIHLLRHFLSLVKARAQQAGLIHIVRLYHRCHNEVRDLKRKRQHRFAVARAHPSNHGLTDEALMDRMNIHRLSTSAPTNDRDVVLFLYDAPLSRLQVRRHSAEVTEHLLAEHGWTRDTVLIRACDAYRQRPVDRLQVVDALLWQDHRDQIQANLAPFHQQPAAESAFINVTPEAAVSSSLGSSLAVSHPEQLVNATAEAAVLPSSPPSTGTSHSRLRSPSRSLAGSRPPSPLSYSSPRPTSPVHSRPRSPSRSRSRSPAPRRSHSRTPTHRRSRSPVRNYESRSTLSPAHAHAPAAAGPSRSSFRAHKGKGRGAEVDDGKPTMTCEDTATHPAIPQLPSPPGAIAGPSGAADRSPLGIPHPEASCSRIQTSDPPTPSFQPSPMQVDTSPIPVSIDKGKARAVEDKDSDYTVACEDLLTSSVVPLPTSTSPSSLLPTGSGCRPPGGEHVTLASVPNVRVLKRDVTIWYRPTTTIPSQVRRSHSFRTWWLLRDPETGLFAPAVADTALLFLPRLPAELILRILRLTCESQASYLEFCQQVLGIPLWSHPHQADLGPLLCEPLWIERRPRPRHAFPRPGDEGMDDPHIRVDRIRQQHILPTVTMKLGLAKELWSFDRWRDFPDCAVDMIGTSALSGRRTEEWDTDADIQRFFQDASVLYTRLQRARGLRRLDLRLGVWTLYGSTNETPLHFDSTLLYSLMEFRNKIEWLSIALDVRAWSEMELRDDAPVLDFEQILGYGYKPVTLPPVTAPIEVARSQSGAALPPPVLGPPRNPRAKLRFVRVVMPAVEMKVEPSLFPYLMSGVVHFELVCQVLHCNHTATQVVHFVASTFSHTLETLRITILGEEGRRGGAHIEDHPQDHDKGPVRDRLVQDKRRNGTFASTQEGRTILEPMLLPRLRTLHLELDTLDPAMLRCFEAPLLSLLVLRAPDPWVNDDNFVAMRDGLRNLKYGQMGPFRTKQLALRAYEHLTGYIHQAPLLEKTFTLHDEAWVPFDNFDASGSRNQDSRSRGRGPSSRGGWRR